MQFIQYIAQMSSFFYFYKSYMIQKLLREQKWGKGRGQGKGQEYRLLENIHIKFTMGNHTSELIFFSSINILKTVWQFFGNEEMAVKLNRN